MQQEGTVWVVHGDVREQHPAWTVLQGWLMISIYIDANVTRKAATSKIVWLVCCLGQFTEYLHKIFDTASPAGWQDALKL